MVEVREELRSLEPDATSLLKSRHLLEADDLPRQIFGEVGEVLSEINFLIKEGAILDCDKHQPSVVHEERKLETRP